ncbi:MAG: hypothetical protein ACOCRK_06305 [bacterium]
MSKKRLPLPVNVGDKIIIYCCSDMIEGFVQGVSYKNGYWNILLKTNSNTKFFKWNEKKHGGIIAYINDISTIQLNLENKLPDN